MEKVLGKQKQHGKKEQKNKGKRLLEDILCPKNNEYIPQSRPTLSPKEEAPTDILSRINVVIFKFKSLIPLVTQTRSPPKKKLPMPHQVS